MDMTDFEFKYEQCLEMAKEFLTTKERVDLYGFIYFDEEANEEMMRLYPLEDDVLARLRAAKERDGDKWSLSDVFDNQDEIYDYIEEKGDNFIDIDIKHVLHRYKFSIQEIKPDGTNHSYPWSITLSDDEYARLLAWNIHDVHLTINLLRYRDRELYDKIMDDIDRHYYNRRGECLLVDNPYVPMFDEAKADAEAAVKKYGIEEHWCAYMPL